MNQTFLFFIFISFLVSSPAPSFAGACGQEGEIGLTRRIDGPANLRDKPGGKLVNALPNGTSVNILEYQAIKKPKFQSWYLVEYTENGIKYNAWTHEQNLVCD